MWEHRQIINCRYTIDYIQTTKLTACLILLSGDAWLNCTGVVNGYMCPVGKLCAVSIKKLFMQNFTTLLIDLLWVPSFTTN